MPSLWAAVREKFNPIQDEVARDEPRLVSSEVHVGHAAGGPDRVGLKQEPGQGSKAVLEAHLAEVQTVGRTGRQRNGPPMNRGDLEIAARIFNGKAHPLPDRQSPSGIVALVDAPCTEL